MKKLSIVIPTKDRVEYLTICLKSLLEINSEDFEIVIQDNSNDNREITSFLRELNDERLIYHYNSEQLSVIENCDLGIKNSIGSYVTLLGDDDGVTHDIMSAVDWMESNNFDALTSSKPIYIWPDTSRQSNSFTVDLAGKLVINSFNNTYRIIDPNKERQKVLSIGATSLLLLPKLYHGIVRRDVLENIFKTSGSYFPGPSPDMANAIATSVFSKSYVYVDYPIFVSGKGAKSTSGMGLAKKHTGEIENQKFLPKETVKNWTEEIPFFWSGQTIWAESAIQSLNRVNRSTEMKCFNFDYLYSELFMYEFFWRDRINEKIKYSIKSSLKMIYYFVLIFNKRLFSYLKNFVRYRLNLNKEKTTSSQINNIQECINFIMDKKLPSNKIWTK
ncbi:glycosyltransferase family 2 protein [Marivirga harenae]|uniref:glycosyltransferase family 2 protein n=1 Tax=Marivirga harenae TaxID=2010992 RepID=UPI0026DF6A8F|nr:glycosyltransferase family A protein [Marivirga harenae]WKV13131.1 glycosyltransferase family A protein [Marivirga harenae]